MSQQIVNKYMTVTECAKTLRVTQATILRWLKNGTLKGIRIQKKFLVTEESFLELVKTSTVVKD